MNKHTKLRVFGILFLPALVVLLSLVTSCESSRTAPVIPITTPVTPPSALYLNGDVKDADNNSAIGGAIVTISKLDGSGVTTTTTDNNGQYQYDLTNVDASQLKITATKSSYGIASALADIDKTQYTAVVGVISLKKIVGVSATATAASGGTASAPSSESKSSTPASVNVPPGAVNQNTTVTVAPVPINQAPPAASGEAPSLTVLNLEPSGITFNVPVTVIFPLPTQVTAGESLNLRTYNTTTGQWEDSGFKATVGADGLTASGQVTHFSTWEVRDQRVSITQGTDAVVDRYEEVTDFNIIQENGKHVVKLPTNYTFDIPTGDGFSESYMKGQMSSKLNISFSSTTVSVGAEQPPLPEVYKKVVGTNTVQYNPTTNSTNGKWTWKPRIFKKYTTSFFTFSNRVGSQSASVSYLGYYKNGDVWTWVETHNQGG